MVLAHARLIWWQAPIGDVQPTKKYIVTTTTTPVVNHRETRQLFPASNSFTKAANMSFLCSLAGRSSSRIRVWIPWLNAITRYYGAYNMEKITWILEVNPRLITTIAIVASQTSICIYMIDTDSPSQGSFQSRCKSSSQTNQAHLTCIQASSIPNTPRENNKETTGSKGPGLFYLENPFK